MRLCAIAVFWLGCLCCCSVVVCLLLSLLLFLCSSVLYGCRLLGCNAVQRALHIVQYTSVPPQSTTTLLKAAPEKKFEIFFFLFFRKKIFGKYEYYLYLCIVN